MSNYILISAQEFCDTTGLTTARFKRYRSLFRAAPTGQEPFPQEVYEYNSTVIFDAEELCEWFIDLYEAMVIQQEALLSEAVKTLQQRIGVNDLNTLDDLTPAVSRARLRLASYPNRERATLQKQLEEAHKNFLKLPREILASKKVLTEAQRILEKLPSA